MRLGTVLAISCVFALSLSTAPAFARMTVWDLKPGTAVADMPDWLEFKGYACGSNGGPPLEPIAGWQDFKRCAADADGLHEVYFEYDDEDEYIARAHQDIRVARDVGTVDKSFPIVTSALFDDNGILEGIRIVTDPRPAKQIDNEWVNLRPRAEHHLLASYLASQFKISVADNCEKLPKGAGESAVGGQFLKLDCERDSDSLRYLIEQRLLRKPGQAARDPHTGQLTQGQFESVTRAEVRLLKP
ncbi:hypothetical protein [Paradevosia shaoguanensis]|uniref:hypothetical protein n=1 Tax=Paradevosia shaoguanensis TaxID=1335043 RepID=UPI00193427BB|nr:hypothetical protein [Paradevosia shaoguanensis]